MIKSRKIFFILLLCIACFILVSPSFLPANAFHSWLPDSLQTPSTKHWLGTDADGRDLFYMIIYGTRLSLLISICVVSLCFISGLLIGSFAATLGGPVDRLFIFVADVFQAFPGILLAIALAAFLNPSVMNLIMLLSFVGWVSYARVVRAQVIELNSREFIEATHALGHGSWRRLFKHVLPNIAGPLIVQASFGLAGVILAESSLTFLGLGLPQDTPSLGRILDGGVDLLLIAPHVSLFPGAVILLFVLTFNKLGDYFRSQLVSP